MGICGSSAPAPAEMQSSKGDSIIMRRGADGTTEQELEVSKGASIMLSSKAFDKDWKPGDPISYPRPLVRAKEAVVRAGARNVRATYGCVAAEGLA